MSSCLKAGARRCAYRREAIRASGDGEARRAFAEGAFTFVALDENDSRARSRQRRSEMADTYDLIVLGSGPGGYVAAIRAAQLGLKTAIVERENLGGICLNWGCIPTKALLRSAEMFHYMQHAEAYGLEREQGRLRPRQGRRAQPRRRQAAQPGRHAPDEEEQDRRAHGRGQAHRQGQADGDRRDGKATELAAKHIIVATGARARDLPFAKADGKRIWTYRHAMTPPEMPTELLVIGSGAIGIEFASFYADLGAKVTVVEMLDRVVPVEDAEVSDFLAKQLTKQGMKILTGAGVESLKADAKGVAAKIKTKDGKSAEHRFSHAIVAVGIAPNTENIGLEALGRENRPRATSTPTPCAAPTCRASGRSATSPRRPGSRTRRATKA